MKKVIRSTVFSGCAVLIFTLMSDFSEAKIRCDGIYQTNSVGTFASPYCEDNYLAKIARSYGMRVSNKTIRQNPNKKESVCRFIGHDTRVREICRGLRSSPHGGSNY